MAIMKCVPLLQSHSLHLKFLQLKVSTECSKGINVNNWNQLSRAKVLFSMCCGNDGRWITRPLLVASQRWCTLSSSVSLSVHLCGWMSVYQALSSHFLSLYFDYFSLEFLLEFTVQCIYIFVCVPIFPFLSLPSSVFLTVTYCICICET